MPIVSATGAASGASPVSGQGTLRPQGTATATRAAFVQQEFRSIVWSSAPVRTQYGKVARDTKDEPIVTFFDLSEDCYTIAQERGKILGSHARRFRVVLGKILTETDLPFASALPGARLIDDELAADLDVAVASIESVDFNSGQTTLVVWGRVGDIPNSDVRLRASPGSAGGTSLAQAISRVIFTGVGAASGSGVAAAASGGVLASAGAAVGYSTPAATGRGIAASIGATSGVGTASAVSNNSGSLGAASGVGTATAVGSSTAASAGASSGVGTAAGTAPEAATSATGASSGSGTAASTGRTVSSATGVASGVGTATATGSTVDGATDANFSTVKLLMGFEGANGGTTFTDESTSPATFTTTGTPTTSTTLDKFGTASLRCDGSSSINQAISGNKWDPASSDFTIEMFASFDAPNTGSWKGLMGWGANPALALSWTPAGGGTWEFLVRTINQGNVGGQKVSFGTLVANQFYHVVVERSGGTIRGYVDGVMQFKSTSATGALETPVTNALRIGHSINGFHAGYIDEFRISHFARYASDAGYVVPTAAFPRTGPAPAYVGGTTGAFTESGTVSLTGLTGGLASAPVEGDTVVVAVGQYGNIGDVDVSIGAGWTEIFDLVQSPSFALNFGMFYKRMGATPDTSFTTNATNNNTGVSVAVHVWRNINATTPLDVTSVSAGANTSTLDMPAITPVTSGAIIVVAAAAGNVSTAFSQPGSELSNFTTVYANAALDSCCGMGSKAWTSGAFDPANWTATDVNSWIAATIALRPA